MVLLARNSVPNLLRSQALPTIQVAFYGDHAPRKTISPSALKRGTGGRSSFNGIVATVFGSSGFLGRYVCNKLGKTGTQIILPYRCEYYWMRPLKLAGDLGQVLFQEFELRDEDSIYKSLKYSNVVINLIGREWETRNFKFHDVHVDGARRLARIARQAGVEKFIHLSSLNADPDIEKAFLPKGSGFLKSKYEGELAVREEFPDATIIRPAPIYGQEDTFLNVYTNTFRLNNFKILPLWKAGEETIKQPVFVEDVAQGIVNAIKDRDAVGKTYNAIGPKRYYMADLMDWVFLNMRRRPDFGFARSDSRSSPLYWLKLGICHNIPGKPVAGLSYDMEERGALTDKVNKRLPTLEDLGVELTDFELQAPWEVKQKRYQSIFEERTGAIPYIPPLQAVLD